MARLTDIFSSDDRDTSSSSSREQDSSDTTTIDSVLDSATDATQDGVSFSNQNYSEDEDGNVEASRTDLEVGGTDLGNNLDVENMLENMTNSSSSSSESSETQDA